MLAKSLSNRRSTEVTQLNPQRDGVLDELQENLLTRIRETLEEIDMSRKNVTE
jgi:hypothetical protein